MTEDQKIYQEIGKLLYSIMPEEASVIRYRGGYYENHKQAGAVWFDHNDQAQYFDEQPRSVYAAIDKQLEALQNTARFKNSPFNHCHITLSEKGKFNIKFADVLKGDHAFNIFMRGMSELTFGELQSEYISPHIWLYALRKTVWPHHENEIKKAQEAGNEAKVKTLQAKLDFIDDNLAKFSEKSYDDFSFKDQQRSWIFALRHILPLHKKQLKAVQKPGDESAAELYRAKIKRIEDNLDTYSRKKPTS